MFIPEWTSYHAHNSFWLTKILSFSTHYETLSSCDTNPYGIDLFHCCENHLDNGPHGDSLGNSWRAFKTWGFLLTFQSLPKVNPIFGQFFFKLPGQWQRDGRMRVWSGLPPPLRNMWVFPSYGRSYRITGATLVDSSKSLWETVLDWFWVLPLK